MQAFQVAIEEAREALDRSRGKPGPVRHNPPAQLQARSCDAPVASQEVLFGSQQHPRAQPLIIALQKGASSHSSERAGGGGGTRERGDRTRSASASAETSNQGAAAAAAASAATSPGAGEGTGAGGGPTGRSRPDNSALRGPHNFPAWPELVLEAGPTAADVQAVDGATALNWIRALARGCTPVSAVFQVFIF